LLVTNAPAVMTTSVAHAVNTAKAWWARLYVAGTEFRKIFLRSGTLAGLHDRGSPATLGG
jgi:hypothetical protein